MLVAVDDEAWFGAGAGAVVGESACSQLLEQALVLVTDCEGVMPPASPSTSFGRASAISPPSRLPATAVTGATFSSAGRVVPSMMSPAWMMWLTPAKISRIAGCR
jgi:hypothetical protein